MTASDLSTSKPRMVVVVGSGRSGTSTVAGVLRMLGLRIPGPEVPGDKTNPRGFFEPQWAVKFQGRLLRRASVLLTDARPAAFSDTARIAERQDVRDELGTWLRGHVEPGVELLVKDPRSSWFLPMWRRAAVDAGAEVSFLTMLRHPAEVVGSKDTYYSGKSAGETPRHAQTTRVASWVNVALFTEANTRDAKRAIVLYNEILNDWRHVTTRTLAELGLRERALTDAVAAEVDDFVDPGLRRVRTGWDEIDCPDAVRDLAQEVWEQLCVLAANGGFDDRAQTRLDSARERYVGMYADAEALAQSSAENAMRMGARQARNKLLHEQHKDLLDPGASSVRRMARRVRARLAR